MSCVSAVRERIDQASHPAGNYKNNLFERVGVFLYAPLRHVIKLYEEKDSALAKLVLAIATIVLMPLFVIGAIFHKIGSCCNSGHTSRSANVSETAFEAAFKALEDAVVRRGEKIDTILKQIGIEPVNIPQQEDVQSVLKEREGMTKDQRLLLLAASIEQMDPQIDKLVQLASAK